MSGLTSDLFLGGKLTVRQPAAGFRSGLDAVMLAAAVPARSGAHVLELGAGAGAASLCLAARVPGCRVEGVDIDAGLVALANANAAANGEGERVRFETADALALPEALRRDFDHVMTNPPFHGRDGAWSADAARERALRDTGRFADWLTVGLKRVVSGGSLTAVFAADRLAEALAVMPARGVTVFPLWPRMGEPAKRVILRAVKGSRAAFALRPGLVLHGAGNAFTPEAEAILRDGASLALERPRR